MIAWKQATRPVVWYHTLENKQQEDRSTYCIAWKSIRAFVLYKARRVYSSRSSYYVVSSCGEKTRPSYRTRKGKNKHHPSFLAWKNLCYIYMYDRAWKKRRSTRRMDPASLKTGNRFVLLYVNRILLQNARKNVCFSYIYILKRSAPPDLASLETGKKRIVLSYV